MQSNLGTVNVKVNPYIEMGKQEGKRQEKIEIAKKLIGMGVDIRTITNATGLSQEEIDILTKTL